MKKFRVYILVVYGAGNPPPRKPMPHWMVLLAYLAYLYTVRPQEPPIVVILRTLIVVMGLAAVVAILAAAGMPDVIPWVLRHWPFIP